MFTLIFGPATGTGGEISVELAEDLELKYLSGRQLGDLLDAKQRATAATLAAKGCPTQIISMDTVDEIELGQLMMHFMLETIISADLMGVNTFDQPAVEDGKNLARQYLQQ